MLDIGVHNSEIASFNDDLAKCAASIGELEAKSKSFNEALESQQVSTRLRIRPLRHQNAFASDARRRENAKTINNVTTISLATTAKYHHN